MTITHYLANFFAGLFLCNCIPHLAAGLRGEPFPTPFARPPGRGDSAPVINFLWGSLNLFAGIMLVAARSIFIGWSVNFAVFVTGFLICGIHLSLHFGKVKQRQPGK